MENKTEKPIEEILAEQVVTLTEDGYFFKFEDPTLVVYAQPYDMPDETGSIPDDGTIADSKAKLANLRKIIDWTIYQAIIGKNREISNLVKVAKCANQVLKHAYEFPDQPVNGEYLDALDKALKNVNLHQG
jgi:hypothetical protein